MSLHIHRFVDLIKSTEARGQRDVFMSLREAKDLNADITKLLLTLETLREQQDKKDEVIQVELAGGSFKNP